MSFHERETLKNSITLISSRTSEGLLSVSLPLFNSILSMRIAQHWSKALKSPAEVLHLAEP